MAHVLNLVFGGTTITLASSSKRLISYVPQTPALAANVLDALLGGALDPNSDGAPTLVETATVEISGANAAAIQTAIRALQNLLTVDAPLRQRTKNATKAYVTYLPDGGSATYRSEILAGDVRLAADSQNYARWFINLKVNVIISWERRIYWESTSETQIPLTNGNGTNDTGGLTVLNHDDADSGDDNYVALAAAAVPGLLPTPAKIIAANGSGASLGKIHIGHMATGVPVTFSHMLEAEDASLNATYAAAAVDASCSGGDRVNVSALPTSAVTLCTWTLTANALSYMGNNWFNLMMRFAASGLPSVSTIQVRFRLVDSLDNNTVVAETKWINLSTTDGLQSIDVMRIFPAIFNTSVLVMDHNLILEARDSGGTGTFRLDFVSLMPVENGRGYRLLRPISSSGGLTDANELVDDGVEPDLYVIHSSVYRRKTHQGFGGPIMLRPNVDQRLYFLYSRPDGAHTIVDDIVVKVYCRPRILSI